MQRRNGYNPTFQKMRRHRVLPTDLIPLLGTCPTEPFLGVAEGQVTMSIDGVRATSGKTRSNNSTRTGSAVLLESPHMLIFAWLVYRPIKVAVAPLLF
jgi:hypothetical protein